MSNQRFLTIANVASELGMSKSAIYQAMDAGKLPYLRMGRARRVERVDVERFIEANKTGGWLLPELDSESSGQLQRVVE